MGQDRDVAVIGCGLMGSALARTLARNGFSVKAWNRTFERAEALASNGVMPVQGIRDAIQPVGLIVACTATYETTHSALAAADGLHGKTLINVGTSTPEEAEVMERWAVGEGATYLDGAIICYPPEIGTPGALILYSGSLAAWSDNEEMLKALAGSSRYVSERVGSASVLDGAIVGLVSCAALGACVEAATYVQSQDIPLDVFDELMTLGLDVLRSTAHEAIAAIDTDEHTTNTATISTYAAGLRSFHASMRSAGHKARFLEAVLRNLEDAEAAGLGELGFSAQTKIARNG